MVDSQQIIWNQFIEFVLEWEPILRYIYEKNEDRAQK
jgi:hypothetical protein